MNWLNKLLGKTPAPPQVASGAAQPQATPQVARTAPEGELLVNAYCTVRDLPPLAFEHRLQARRDWQDPALAPHLAGFVQHMLSRGDAQMTQRRYALMRHIERTQQQVSMVIREQAWPTYLAWAQRANAISFLPSGSILDAQGRELLNLAGDETDPAAELPHPPDALARKARSEAALAKHGLRTPPSLPAVLGEAELRQREPAEIAARAFATLAAAVRAEALANGNDLSSEAILAHLPDAQAALSPQETAFMAEAAPDAQWVANMGWRYECVAVFAWALGLRDELPFPAAIVDVAPLTQSFVDAGDVAGLLAQAQPRAASELLDALDETLRLHWVVRDAQIQQAPPPEDVLPGVVIERHRALNWLVRFENADWDEVDTPT